MYQSTVSQIGVLEPAWRVGNMTPAARGGSARQAFRLRRSAGDPRPSGGHISSLDELATAPQERGRWLDVGDLLDPATIARRAGAGPARRDGFVLAQRNALIKN